MWYQSGTGWEVHDGRPEPCYHLKYAESRDGILWDRRGVVSVEFKSKEEGGITRPCVLREGDDYRMWYSYRGRKDYRTIRSHSYRIGYSESMDGVRWTRKDENVGIDVSDTGWDSEMIAYPYVYEHRERKYMVYNGNGFGKSGFGYAVLEEERNR